MRRIIVLLLLLATAAAVDFTWTGPGSVWEDAGNWGGGGFPQTDGDRAIFLAAAPFDAATSGSITVGEIDIQSGYTGTVTFNGPLVVTNLGGHAGSITITEPTATFDTNGQTITTIGDITNHGIIVPGDGTIVDGSTTAVWYHYGDNDWTGVTGGTWRMKDLTFALKASETSDQVGATLELDGVTIRADLNDGGGATVTRTFRPWLTDTFRWVSDGVIENNGDATYSANIVMQAYGAITYSGTPTVTLTGGTATQRGYPRFYIATSVFYNLVIDEHDVDAVRFGQYEGNGVTVANELTVNTNAKLLLYQGHVGQDVPAKLNLGTSSSVGTLINNGELSLSLNDAANSHIIRGVSSSFPALITGNEIVWDGAAGGDYVGLENVDVQYDITTGGNGIELRITDDVTLDKVTVSAGDTFSVLTPGTTITASNSFSNYGTVDFQGANGNPITYNIAGEFRPGADSTSSINFEYLDVASTGFAIRYQQTPASNYISDSSFTSSASGGALFYAGANSIDGFSDCTFVGSDDGTAYFTDVTLGTVAANAALDSCTFDSVTLDSSGVWLISKDHNGVLGNWKYWGVMSTAAALTGYEESDWDENTNLELLNADLYTNPFNTAITLSGDGGVDSLIINTDTTFAIGDNTMGLRGGTLIEDGILSFGTGSLDGQWLVDVNVKGDGVNLNGATVTFEDQESTQTPFTTDANGDVSEWISEWSRDSGGTTTLEPYTVTADDDGYTSQLSDMPLTAAAQLSFDLSEATSRDVNQLDTWFQFGSTYELKSADTIGTYEIGAITQSSAEASCGSALPENLKFDYIFDITCPGGATNVEIALISDVEDVWYHCEGGVWVDRTSGGNALLPSCSLVAGGATGGGTVYTAPAFDALDVILLLALSVVVAVGVLYRRN